MKTFENESQFENDYKEYYKDLENLNFNELLNEVRNSKGRYCHIKKHECVRRSFGMAFYFDIDENLNKTKYLYCSLSN